MKQRKKSCAVPSYNTDYEQATKNAFRAATLVYGFLTDFGEHSRGRFDYGTF